ncbi:MAG: hypothetical protein JWP84_2907 [Tardiphaga sp.]|nr:hypothetical protein [Tardiphaga sp.]
MRIGLRSGIAIAGVWLALGPAFAQSNPAKQNPGVAQSKNEIAPVPGANSFSEAQARTLIEAQGYADVSPLMNDHRGIWQGTAKKGGNKVHVSVDFKGHVTARHE